MEQLAAFPTLGLSARELEAVWWAAKGLKYKEIAAKMGVSEQTTKNQLANARLKANCSTTIELFALLGWLIVPDL